MGSNNVKESNYDLKELPFQAPTLTKIIMSMQNIAEQSSPVDYKTFLAEYSDLNIKTTEVGKKHILFSKHDGKIVFASKPYTFLVNKTGKIEQIINDESLFITNSSMPIFLNKPNMNLIKTRVLRIDDGKMNNSLLIGATHDTRIGSYHGYKSASLNFLPLKHHPLWYTSAIVVPIDGKVAILNILVDNR